MPAGLTDSRLTPSRAAWLALTGVTLAGLVVRGIPVALADFPVNDGGLFVAMVRAIQDAGWALPDTVAWNGLDLPFAYPPLAFYTARVLESAFGLDLFGVFRWFPLVTAALIVPAVYLLGRELLRSEIGGLVAALAYALPPASYVWLIQGGGVTRSPGLLLAVLAVWQVVKLVREPTRARAMAVGLLAGLTALVHPGAGVFVAVSAALIWLFEGRTRPSAARAAVALGIATLVVAPWALTVISRHGLAAFTDVPSNGPDPLAAVVAVVAGRYTGLPFTDPLAILGFALAVLGLIQRRFLLPLWFVAGIALSYQYAMVPFGLLVGVAALDLVALRASAATTAATGATRWIPSVGLGVLAVCLVIEGVASALTVTNPGAPVYALSPDRRAAMAWVGSELEPTARVAVITDSVFTGDPDSEWFPVVAERRSVATVQGYEWLGKAAFEEQVVVHRSLQGCVRPASVSCVHNWLAEWPADYLYLPIGPLHGPNSPADCCAELRAGLLADPAFTAIRDGPGATILRVNSPSTAMTE